MKWDPPQGSTQHTADGRYAIVQANSQDWIAYKLTPYGTGEDLWARGRLTPKPARSATSTRRGSRLSTGEGRESQRYASREVH